jgi:hypothetical protein
MRKNGGAESIFIVSQKRSFLRDTSESENGAEASANHAQNQKFSPTLDWAETYELENYLIF